MFFLVDNQLAEALVHDTDSADKKAVCADSSHCVLWNSLMCGYSSCAHLWIFRSDTKGSAFPLRCWHCSWSCTALWLHIECTVFSKPSINGRKHSLVWNSTMRKMILVHRMCLTFTALSSAKHQMHANHVSISLLSHFTNLTLQTEHKLMLVWYIQNACCLAVLSLWQAQNDASCRSTAWKH
jgi:hypothetical protein